MSVRSKSRWTVCFADLVGFTELGEAIAPVGLGAVAGRLTDLAIDCARSPVRLDLRHTFGTLGAAIWPLHDLQGHMGHADIQTTMIYVHHVPKVAAADELAMGGPSAARAELQSGAGSS